MTFTIDAENEVVAREVASALQPGMVAFTTQEEFEEATRDWPVSRLADVWNLFAGVPGPFRALKPVKKFQDRRAAVTRIWTAIQDLPPIPAPGARREKAAAAPTDREKRREHAPRPGTQAAKVVGLLTRDGGATLEELMAATGWLAHTVRGFVSTLPKKTGLAVTSTQRPGDKARVYAAR